MPRRLGTWAPADLESYKPRAAAVAKGGYHHIPSDMRAAAYMAVAQQLFARIGNDWDASVWGSKEKFDTSRTAFSAAN